jgi:MtrB/PioB family decaheme-associated outer membrane protein
MKMRMKALGSACLVLCGMLALGPPALAMAQGTVTVAGTVGVRDYTKDPDSLTKGKFEEYRDMHAGQKSPASLVLEQGLVRYTPADSFGVYQLGMRNLLDRDQSLWLMAKQPGNFDFQLRWDRIPHTYSTTARSPGNETNPGFNTLPIPRPDSTAWKNAPYVGAIRSQWDPVKASLSLTPSDKFDFKAEYTHIDKNGGMPGSVSFNGAAGPTREFVAPIDQTIDDIRLSQGFASGDRSKKTSAAFIKSYSVQASYAYSHFENALSSVMVDNPQLGASSPTLGAATSRVSLAPSNSAHTGVLTGAITLPMRTRVMATISESWQYQNAQFVPQTSNDSLSKVANFGLVSTLPRTSLDGMARTSVLNFSVNSHPTDRLTVSAKYRNFDYSNQTDPFHVKAMVINDRTVTPADSLTSELHPFSKENQDVSAAYRLANALTLTAGYGWEGWARDTAVRNVATTNERTPRVSLDYTGISWLTVRTSYTQGSRRGAYTVLDATETVGFRPFDLADRDRARTNIMASVTPLDNLTLAIDYEIGNDNYPHSSYGTQSDKSTMTGFDLDWSPTSRFTVSVGYSMEDFNNLLQLRYKTGADTVRSPTYNNPTFNWYNRNTDKNRTTYASFTGVIIPGKLDIGGTYSLADSHFWVYNGNPVLPTGGTIAQDSAATTVDFPEVKQRMEPMSLFLRYRYSANWAITLRFQTETYRETDFRTAAPPYAASATGVIPGSIGTLAGSNTGVYHFLGSTYLPYNAAWFTLLVSYHPAAMPFSKGRSAF